MAVRMSMIAPPVPLEVKGFEGEVVGTEMLSLKVADPETAKGLVHRYLVKVRRDMRKVGLRGDAQLLRIVRTGECKYQDKR